MRILVTLALLSLLPCVGARQALARLPVRGGVTADECSEIDLRKPGGSMAKMKVLDQGALPICFSYVAAQMADAWRISHGGKPPEQGIIPIWVATHHELRRDSRAKVFKAGYTCDGVEAIRAEGACHSPMMSVAGKESVEWATILLKLYQDYQARLGSIRFASKCNRSDMKRLLRDNERVIEKIESHLGCTFSAKQPFDDFIGPVIGKVDPIQTLARGLLEVCNGSVIGGEGVPKCQRQLAEGSAAMGMVHELLERKNPQPVNISYCELVLQMPRPFRGGTRISDKRPCAHHASLVIGRKRIRGRCHLLVRNTWGTGCGHYADAGWLCEKGDIWVDQEDLGRNTYSVATLDQPPRRPSLWEQDFDFDRNFDFESWRKKLLGREDGGGDPCGN